MYESKNRKFKTRLLLCAAVALLCGCGSRPSNPTVTAAEQKGEIPLSKLHSRNRTVLDLEMGEQACALIEATKERHIWIPSNVSIKDADGCRATGLECCQVALVTRMPDGFHVHLLEKAYPFLSDSRESDAVKAVEVQ